jgi:beta-lactamase class A
MASVIKLPILVELMRRAAAGRMALDERAPSSPSMPGYSRAARA